MRMIYEYNMLYCLTVENTNLWSQIARNFKQTDENI